MSRHREQELSGTPAYTALEQMGWGRSDNRCRHLWGLGLFLYEIIPPGNFLLW